MLPRLPHRLLIPVAQLRDNPSKWFTKAEAAEDLQIHVSTLERWLGLLTREGLGPTPDQISVKRLNAARRIKRWRGDYLVLVERRFVLKIRA